MIARAAVRSPAMLAALAAGFSVMLLGGLMTDRGPWFDGLAKPDWRPPGWLFAPVWTSIFALAAFSFATAWSEIADRSDRRQMVTLFSINAAFNMLWSFLFFQLHRPDWALVDVGLLWFSILALIGFLWRQSRTAAVLLFPYIGWVSFAASLNFAIVRLNAPF